MVCKGQQTLWGGWLAHSLCRARGGWRDRQTAALALAFSAILLQGTDNTARTVLHMLPPLCALPILNKPAGFRWTPP